MTIETTCQELIELLKNDHLTIVTAESCTGGLISSSLTDIPGSSEVVYGSFVSYANEAKVKMLNVENQLIENYGAVSQEVALAMAKGALLNSSADISVAVTGIAGPSGGTNEKPVGLVHMAVASKAVTKHAQHNFGAKSRNEIKRLTVEHALKLVISYLGN